MKKIQLAAQASDDLNWQGAAHLAERENDLFWKIDLGLEIGALHLKDPILFSSCALALEQFVKELWPRFKEHSRGLSLYDGVFDLSTRLVWDAMMEEHFSEMLQDRGLSSADVETREIQRTLFMTDLFAQFLHRLLSILPEELEVNCQFDVTAFKNSALLASLFSRARFEHLKCVVKGTTLPIDMREAEVGVLIPTDPMLTRETLQKLESLISGLQKEQRPFRFIHELLLADEWDGLEKLILVPEAVSGPGKRLLHGFVIAGGEVVSV